jgi:hypothetical protein
MLADREPWMAEGACRGLAETLGGRERDRLFYPTRGEPTKRAEAMCADCPVRQECLDFALRNGMHFGIWGGMSESERQRMRREMRITTPMATRPEERPQRCPECNVLCTSGAGLTAHRKTHAREAVST